MSQQLCETVTITNQRGLHARASAKFVNFVAALPDTVTVEVEKDGTRVSGTSIMGLMMLGAAIGTSITVDASGPQAAEAMDALDQLVASKFDEE